VLSLDHVTKSYWRGPRRIEALCDVSLTVEPGGFVAIHGGVRAGKSTLLRVAAGIEPPDAGRVSYRGTDLASMTERELARHRRRTVGCAWCRSAYAGTLSVLDYVAMPLFADRVSRRAAHRQAHETLERVGIEPLQGDRVLDRSDGERRRIEFAQALVRDPAILLADEPVSNADLNYVEGDQILELLQSLADTGTTVMITSADLHGAMRAGQIMGLDRGRLMAVASRLGELIELPQRSSATSDQPPA
jgi:putative ABC transport system ATP-binding protein